LAIAEIAAKGYLKIWGADRAKCQGNTNLIIKFQVASRQVMAVYCWYDQRLPENNQTGRLYARPAWLFHR
jgi:hypothetical protein